jgi:hypothetical protein
VIVHDLTGRRVPAGKVHRQRVWNCLDPRPGWLSVVNGTGTLVPPAFELGHYRLGNSTANGAMTLRTTSTHHLPVVRELAFTVEGLQVLGTVANLEPAIEIQNSLATQGVALYQRAADRTAILRVRGTALNITTTYNLTAGGEAGRSRNLTLGVLPLTKEVYVAEDDQVMWMRRIPQLILAGVQPQVASAQRNGNSDGVIRMAQVRLDYIHD